MFAYTSVDNAFFLRTDIAPTQYEDIIVPTVDEDGNPVMESRPKLDADGKPVMQDMALEDGTVVQVPVMEQVQATHTEQSPVYHPLPEGYVDVSEEEHRTLFEAQSEGKAIQPDPAGTGRPVALPTPTPTEADNKLARIAQIKANLSDIDTKAARPLRAMVAGTATDDDRTAVADLEARAQTLRTELAALGGK